MWSNPFQNRTIKIVTKHHKEKVIGPVIEKELGIAWEHLSNIDTDQLGTFTGEVERTLDPLETLRQKCNLGFQKEEDAIVIATEGSFGNHPTIFYATAGEELILLKDKKNDIEIMERVVTLQTNFNSAKITNTLELENFLGKVKFPSHYIIIKASEKDFTNMVKGIQDYKEAFTIFNRFVAIHGYCIVETDMRAYSNPTRMAVIQELTQKLVKKIQATCPRCSCPGYGIVDAKLGLPCSQCQQPTKSILAHQYHCQKCAASSLVTFPFGKQKEDPMYCDYCNP